jgi:hypothetical protein
MGFHASGVRVVQDEFGRGYVRGGTRRSLLRGVAVLPEIEDAHVSADVPTWLSKARLCGAHR